MPGMMLVPVGGLPRMASFPRMERVPHFHAG